MNENTRYLRAVARLLACQLGKTKDGADRWLDWALSDEEKPILLDQATLFDDEPKGKGDPAAEMADSLYVLYPTKCPMTGRSTGKCSKDRKRLMVLIRNNGYDEVRKAISGYLDDCRDHRTMLKNFSTLLNNLPLEDTQETAPPAPQTDDLYQ